MTFDSSLINKLTFTLSLDGRRFHWLVSSCSSWLHLVGTLSSQSLMSDPVGSIDTQHLVNHHKKRRKYDMLPNYLKYIGTKNFSLIYLKELLKILNEGFKLASRLLFWIIKGSHVTSHVSFYVYSKC